MPLENKLYSVVIRCDIEEVNLGNDIINLSVEFGFSSILYGEEDPEH